MALAITIFVIVIAGLVLITINKKKDVSMDAQNGAEVTGNSPENNMENPQDTKGVKITVIKEGNGQTAKSGDTVAMNYTGTLSDGTVFDSNVDPKFNHVQPFVFTIGAGQVISGWDIGVAGMKIGEKRKLVIEPEFAYGEAGAGGVIPPNATLSFDVELIAIKN